MRTINSPTYSLWNIEIDNIIYFLNESKGVFFLRQQKKICNTLLNVWSHQFSIPHNNLFFCCWIMWKLIKSYLTLWDSGRTISPTIGVCWICISSWSAWSRFQCHLFLMKVPPSGLPLSFAGVNFLSRNHSILLSFPIKSFSKIKHNVDITCTSSHTIGTTITNFLAWHFAS